MAPPVEDWPTLVHSSGQVRRPDDAATDPLAVVVVWAREEPHRVGEVALIEKPCLLGRGGARDDDAAPRLQLMRQRPGQTTLTGPIVSPHVSRQQLLLRPAGELLEVERLGRCVTTVNGARIDDARVAVGDTISLRKEMVLYVTRRPRDLRLVRGAPSPARDFEFGTGDAFGCVGESPAAWRLRQTIALAARSDAHVLIHGASGTGKELVAAALHGLSRRAGKPMVSRNAATFPEGIIDAELFGNIKNYPNPGTPEREGVIGEADGSTLFLDEIAELPRHLQAHLLRVMDGGGEYQRLGESKVRRADLRIVAATNRDPAELKHDFAARLSVRVEVPPLTERREDIPLLARHLLQRAARRDGALQQRFFDGNGWPRLEQRLIEALMRHELTTHTRELERLLWRALTESPEDELRCTESIDHFLAAAAETGSASQPEPDRAAVEAALAHADGNVTRAAERLGLKNRFALYRLMKKHGIEGP